MTLQSIISDIIGLTRKNGKRITTDQEITILNGFLTDTLSKTDLTKFKKIIAKFIRQVLPLSAEDINKEVWKQYPNELGKAKVRVYNDIMLICDYDYTWNKPEALKTKEFSKLPVDVQNVLTTYHTNLVWVMENILPAISKYEASFAVKAKKAKEEAKKGLVPQAIYDALLVITEDWKNIIYTKKLDSLKNLRTRGLEAVTRNKGKMMNQYESGDQGFITYCCQMRVLQDNTSDRSQTYDDRRKGNYTPIFSAELDSRLEHDAMSIAVETSQSFLFKMCDKIGGMKQITDDVTVEKVSDWGNPFESAILIEAPSKFRFMMVNSIVHNHSIHGTPYFQFPCIFEGVLINAADGVKKFTRLSETEIKNEINKLK